MKTSYTIKEIDELRSAVDTLVCFGTLRPKNGSWGRSFSAGERETVVEARLRTYMSAGKTAQDLYDAEKLKSP